MQPRWPYLKPLRPDFGGISPIAIAVIGLSLTSILTGVWLLNNHKRIITLRYNAMNARYLALSGFAIAKTLEPTIIPKRDIPEKNDIDYSYDIYQVGYPIRLETGMVYIIDSTTGYRYSIAILDDKTARTCLKRYITSH